MLYECEDSKQSVFQTSAFANGQACGVCVENLGFDMRFCVVHFDWINSPRFSIVSKQLTMESRVKFSFDIQYSILMEAVQFLPFYCGNRLNQIFFTVFFNILRIL